MTDSVDKLLAELKAEYEQGATGKPQPNVVPPPPPPLPKPSESSNNGWKGGWKGGAIDDLLAQIDQPAIQSTIAPRPDPVPRPRPAPPPMPPDAKSFVPQQPSTADLTLDQLKAQYAEQDRLNALKQQQQIQAEQRRQQQRQQQERAAMVKRAEAWLKTLKPHSGDAAWFEAFAANYDSRLEAAIDYVATLSEPPPQ